jgi:type IV pilus assembly protein PilA
MAKNWGRFGRGVSRERGFTLVELMVVVVITGILAMLATYGVRKYVSNSKSAEARNSIGQISKDVSMAFERESGPSTVGVVRTSTGSMRKLCPTAAKVPSTPPGSAKYQSRPTDWSGDAGWKCLKFSMEEPQYFAYQYAASNTTSTAGAYTITANGDLNGNGVFSTFQVNGQVQNGVLTTSPMIGEVSPDE